MKENISLLIVEDDADDRKLFIDAVKEIDNTIDCNIAKDGQYALEILNDPIMPLPDFIFLDLRMPRVNGHKFLMEIKKNERLKGIPVVIYTTSREISDSIELKQSGAFHFMSKPSNPEEIYYLISLVLEELRFNSKY